MRYWVIILTLLVSVPACADSQNTAQRVIDSGILRCGYATSPPVLVKDGNTGKLSGPYFQIVEEIGRKLGLKIEWTEEAGWGNFVEGLRANRYDMMCSSIWPDAARLKVLSLTRPVSFDTLAAFVREGDKRFDGDLKKINNKDVIIGAVDGDITATIAKEKFSNAKTFSLPPSAGVSDLIISLTSKKADVVFTDPVRIAVFEKENPGKIRRVANVDPVNVIGASLGVNAGEFQLRDMVDTALRELINDGTVARELGKASPDLTAPKKGY